MITICARWESTQMDAALEWSMWRQLRGAFYIDRFVMTPIVDEMLSLKDVDQFDTMDEALAACRGERAFLEPTGYRSVMELPQGDIVLVLGNARMHNMQHAHVKETYQIYSPGKTDLYGINAAAIALAVRFGQ